MKGNLGEVAEFSEEIKNTLEKVSDSKESVEDFDYWKPEKDDDEKDIKDRTVSLESISKKKVEKDSNGMREGFSEAREEFENKIRELDRSKENNKPRKANLVETHKKLFKPIASGSLKFFREAEELIYKFMLSFNPYYL